MDLKEQKYVCTLAECKSLTRASEPLYISAACTEPVHQ